MIITFSELLGLLIFINIIAWIWDKIVGEYSKWSIYDNVALGSVMSVILFWFLKVYLFGIETLINYLG